ncbi:hypothetical protein L6452_04370 [Arctium lappa]|uniref:Uncharacterized protein n=1 Tax=Arctium lappa TaxID=4217 RepID=A0ACB9FPX5_ARCLA|nr:hypothetical protein L6452_04370 [Arctium lappa]
MLHRGFKVLEAVDLVISFVAEKHQIDYQQSKLDNGNAGKGEGMNNYESIDESCLAILTIVFAQLMDIVTRVNEALVQSMRNLTRCWFDKWMETKECWFDQWPEVNEVPLRVITMVASILEFGLLQLTRSSRNVEFGHLHLSIPLYIDNSCFFVFIGRLQEMSSLVASIMDFSLF